MPDDDRCSNCDIGAAFLSPGRKPYVPLDAISFSLLPAAVFKLPLLKFASRTVSLSMFFPNHSTLPPCRPPTYRVHDRSAFNVLLLQTP